MNHPTDAFYEKVEGSPELQEKIAAIRQPTVEAATAAMAELAREAGFDLTPEDFAPRSNEISENDLAQVSGGAAGDTTIFDKNRGPKWIATERADGTLQWGQLPPKTKP